MDKVNKVVMIADSDQHVCNLLSRFLAEAGYTVTRADDGYSPRQSQTGATHGDSHRSTLTQTGRAGTLPPD
ncbi:hypothetical protein KBI23_01705 [bacterium]|nr:hypothetical protein [bacterium]MBP9808745.1 hypothetical protein [bacterium]